MVIIRRRERYMAAVMNAGAIVRQMRYLVEEKSRG
jgi:hypothetical protein